MNQNTYLSKLSAESLQGFSKEGTGDQVLKWNSSKCNLPKILISNSRRNSRWFVITTFRQFLFFNIIERCILWIQCGQNWIAMFVSRNVIFHDKTDKFCSFMSTALCCHAVFESCCLFNLSSKEEASFLVIRMYVFVMPRLNILIFCRL